MTKSIAVVALFSAARVWGIDAPPTGPDYASLYKRVSESAFVVRATLANTEAVGRRALPALRKQAGGGFLVELSNDGGILYTLAVTEALCRRTDWFSSGSVLRQPEDLVHIFVPFTEPRYQNNSVHQNRYDEKESFVPGKEYLLFLREDPQQAELGKIYRMDSTRTYYRAYWGRNGAVELPSAEQKGKPKDFVTPLVSAVTAMCEAVQPPDRAAKESRLTQLKNLADPSWRPEVEAAIKALETAPGKQ